MIGPLLVLAALLFGAVLALGQITAYDIWAILAGGRYILAHGLPASDPFSFTAEGRPWANQMWLTQVLFYWTYSTLGRIPLIFFKVLVVVATLAVVWWSASRRSRSPAAASVTTAFVAVAAAPWWHLRPQIFTYLCLALTLACLFAWQQGSRRALWAVPVIMAIWVNLHAGFVIGLGVLGIWWVGILIEGLLGRDSLRGELGSHKDLAVVTGLTALATLANPYGIQVFAFPLRMSTSRFSLETSVDWYSPNFLVPAMIPALGFILFLCAGLALAGRRFGTTDVLLLVAFLGISLRSGRNLPLFLVATAPLLAELAVSATRSLPARWPRVASVTPICLVGLLLLGSGLQASSLRLPAKNPFLQELNENRYPVEVVKFFQTYRPPPELFNAFLWAGYELWALPEYRVFIDNRFEVYPEAIFRDYLEVTYVTPRWEAVLNRWHVRTLIVARESALAQALHGSARWAEVFTGREATVFLRKDALSPLLPLTQGLGELALR